MPIYAYRCEACGFEKDHLQKLSEAALSICPECGQATYKTGHGGRLSVERQRLVRDRFQGWQKAPASATRAPKARSTPPSSTADGEFSKCGHARQLRAVQRTSKATSRDSAPTSAKSTPAVKDKG
jgi:putative FmdB family regulatory protein